MSIPASDRSIVNTARGLMIGGYLPFAALTIGLLFEAASPVDAASILGLLVAYGAIILSFLGGIRWGLAVAHGDTIAAKLLVISVVPSLIGWLALMLSAVPGLVLLAGAFAWHYGWDRRAATAGRMPEWFIKLRLWITAAVVPTLLVAAVITATLIY